jgi:hypothetical protein
MKREKNTYTIISGCVVQLEKLNGEEKLVPVIFRSGLKKERLETDTCPYCFKTHIHGADEGSRIPHCYRENLKDILWPDGRVSKKDYGYYILNRDRNNVITELQKQGGTGTLKTEYKNLP